MYLENSSFEKFATYLTAAGFVESSQSQFVISISGRGRINIVHRVLKCFYPPLFLLLGTSVQSVCRIRLLMNQEPLIRPTGIPSECPSACVILETIIVEAQCLAVTVLISAACFAHQYCLLEHECVTCFDPLIAVRFYLDF